MRCPKCKACVIIIDDVKGEEIERCSRFPRCDYQTKKILKAPKRG